MHFKLMTHSPESEEEYCYACSTHNKLERPKVDITVNGLKVNMLIDTGSDPNIISLEIFNKLKPRPKLSNDKSNVYSYGSKSPLDIAGTFNATIKYKHAEITASVSVSKQGKDNLLGFRAATELGLVKLTYNLNQQLKPQAEQIFTEFKDRFEGVGKLDTPYKLHIDDNVTPVAQPHRRIPFPS